MKCLFCKNNNIDICFKYCNNCRIDYAFDYLSKMIGFYDSKNIDMFDNVRHRALFLLENNTIYFFEDKNYTFIRGNFGFSDEPILTIKYDRIIKPKELKKLLNKLPKLLILS